MQKPIVKTLVALLLIVSVLGISGPIPRVFGAGTLCIGPDLPAQTACPASALALTGPVTTGPSSQIRVQVFLQGSDAMNGADIVLSVDPTVLNPVGVDLTGTLFPAGFTVLAECINGALIQGSTCNSATDVLGTIHVSIVGFGGGLSPTGETGIVFTAVLDIVGSSAGTSIGFQTGTACSGGSVPNTCIRISNGTTTPVSLTSQTASFTSSATQGAIQLSPNGGSLGSLFAGVSPPAQSLAITDVGGAYLASGQSDGGGDTSFTLSTSIIGPTPTATGVSVAASGSPFTFATATPGPFTSMITITSGATTTPGTWSITVTGLYHFDPTCITGVPGSCVGPASTLIQSVTYTLTVVDFTVTVPSTANTFVPYWCSAGGVTGACPAGNGATQTITITPAGFTGTVTIATAVGTPTPTTIPPLSVAYSTTSIAGASGSATVTFSNGVLRPSATVGSYTVRTSLTGTLPSGPRTKTLTWIVRPQDFNITASTGPIGPSLSFNSGSSATDTLTIGSLPSGSIAVNSAGFAGPVTISSTFTGGTGLVVTPTISPVTLVAGQKLTDLVTFSGTVAATTTFSVTITGTATLAGAIPSTTQTHSVTYSITITGSSHPTSTSVACSPSSVGVGQATTCTATVMDSSGAGATTPTGSVTFTSSGTGAFGSAASCSLVAGVTGTASCSVTYTPSAVGTGTHTITASYGGDPSHSTSQGTAPVSVSSGLPSVTVNAPTPNPANTGQTVTVTFSVSSATTVSAITVNWGDGTTDTLAGTATSDTHSYANTGTSKSQVFTIIVTATNTAGSGSGQTTQTVNDRPPAVTISTVSPNPANTGATVTASFTATDPDGTVSSITVNWGDGTIDTLAGTAVTDTHAYANTGAAKSQIFTLTVTATDNSGSTGFATSSETINDRAPTVTVTNVTPNPANTGQLVTVTFTATDSDGTISSFSVNWGDSATDTLAGTATSDTHTYTTSGPFTITVTATDNSGSTGQATGSITVNTPVGVPTVTVNAPTPNPANEGQTVTVTWSVSSTVTVTSTCINWGDGSSACGLTGQTTATHVYSAGTSTSKIFSTVVNATNSAGTGAGTNTETVHDLTPTITFGTTPGSADEGATVSIPFTATDDEAISMRCVNWGDGVTACGITSPATHVFSTGGLASKSFTITVNATDAAGLTGSNTVSITINDVAPTVTITNVSPNPATSGQTVSVSFTTTDDEAIPAFRICIDWGDGVASSTCNITSPVTHAYTVTASTVFTITVNATDSASLSASKTTTVTVNPPVVGAPVVTVNAPTPNPANTGQTVTVTFTVSSTVTVTGITVNWGDGSTDSLAGTATSDTHSYANTGTAKSQSFTITVMATNSAGTGTGTTTETVNDRPPVVTLTNVSPNPTTTGQLVTITFSATDPDGTIVAITITWGDGSTSTPSPGSTTATHTYTSTGSMTTQQFAITISATDNSGSTGSATGSATISDLPPTASFTFTPANPSAGQSVSFDASASADPDGTIASYSWNFGDGTTGTGVNPTHTYNPATNMTFTVALTVTDNSGSTGSASKTLFVLVIPVTPPIVTITNHSPNPANTGQTVTLSFTVSSVAPVTSITVNWGDGTTNSLAGSATSDTHAYSSTGNNRLANFTITVTATNSGGSGSAFTIETIQDRAPTVTIISVTPNPANTGQTVTLSFTATDPDGTVSSITVNWGDGSVADNLPGTATSDTHVYASTGTFTINMTATDNSGSIGSASASETISVVTIQPVTLTFQAFDIDDCDNASGQLSVTVNGQQIATLPTPAQCATLPNGTGDYAPNMNTLVSFGPFDITNAVVQGQNGIGVQNTIIFSSPPPGHFGLFRNVVIMQGSVLLLRVTTPRFVSLTHPVTFTFSIPPLVITSFTASPALTTVGANVTLTATFTGGTSPFRCFFRFGDDNSASVLTTTNTCSVTHVFDDSGNFTARVTVIGSSTSDRASASVNVTVTDPPAPLAPLWATRESSTDDD